MRPLSMLIKPASGMCDMRCGYCFYYDEERHSRGVMTDETVRVLIRKSFDYASGPVAFAFQGGEPTLAGRAFFESFVRAVNEYNKKALPVSFSIQTNGLRIDDGFAAFLAQNGFLTGLSIDGTCEIHDKNRRDAAGKGTFERVAGAAQRLEKAGAEFNILTVVTPSICSQAEKVYLFYKSRGFKYIQFIVCLPNGNNTRFVPTAAQYYKFLKIMFALWMRDIKNGEYVSVRYFDNLVRLIMGYPPELCSMRGECSIQLVFESDGSCYPCDFYVEERYRLGNITENTIEELKRSHAGAVFLDKGRQKSQDCARCEAAVLCRGGCARERGENGKNLYCSAVKAFIREEYENLTEIARRAKRGEVS